MAEDKLIKSGQFTFARLLFLAGCGAAIFGFVWLGGKFLHIGYILLTAVICVLLYLVATDYGVKMDTIDTSAKSPSLPLESALTTAQVSEEIKVKEKKWQARQEKKIREFPVFSYHI